MQDLKVVGKHVVDLNTGECLPLVYEVFSGVSSTDDKRMYSATVRSPEECTDPEQLKDFMQYTTDMRGIKLVSELTWFKKESDYAVRTKGEKALISNKQYELMKQLLDLVVYKNIILCKRSLMCKKLGVEDKHLARKLNQVSEWVTVGEAKKGFIKVLVSPFLGWKGRIYAKNKSLKTFYKPDPMTVYNALYVPFVGPIAPYKAPEWSNSMQTFLDGLNKSCENGWKAKVNTQRIGLEFFVSAEEVSSVPDWTNEQLPEYEESSYYFDSSIDFEPMYV